MSIYITPNGDKSISHRALIIASLTKGQTIIRNLLLGEDCLNSINIFRNLGVKIDVYDDKVIVYGVGLNGLSKPECDLYVGNSGTSIRLISGILAAQKFTSTITGDDSIKSRPMLRIIEPLTKMGAKIISNSGKAPLTFIPSELKSISYDTNMSSAQVKSAILLAGLYCKNPTTVIEKNISRNHTENMLKDFGINVKTEKNTTKIITPFNLTSREVIIPSDISSASYFIVAGIITPGADIIIKNVGINKTRDGIIDICKKMGADIRLLNIRNSSEPVADIRVKYTKNLTSTNIAGSIIPRLIDEIPIISLLASRASGITNICDIGDLKYKECNRIAAIYKNFKNAGIEIYASSNSISIKGKKNIKGGNVNTYSDHRIAMTFEIASLISDKPFILDDTYCIKTSYPDFYKHLNLIIDNY